MRRSAFLLILICTCYGPQSRNFWSIDVSVCDGSPIASITSTPPAQSLVELHRIYMRTLCRCQRGTRIHNVKEYLRSLCYSTWWRLNSKRWYLLLHYTAAVVIVSRSTRDFGRTCAVCVCTRQHTVSVSAMCRANLACPHAQWSQLRMVPCPRRA